MREKGIEDAVNAVVSVNTDLGIQAFSLDIYGQVDGAQIEWFESLQTKFPSYIRYGGLVPFDKSVEVLKEYYALLFPTYYEGEGFAGTIIDAFASGLPIIASDWRYNSEIIKPHINGLLVKCKNVNDLVLALKYISDNKDEWNKMKSECLKEAFIYSPENALRILFDNIR